MPPFYARMPSGSYCTRRFLRTMVTFNWETYTPYSIGFNETYNRLEALA